MLTALFLALLAVAAFAWRHERDRRRVDAASFVRETDELRARHAVALHEESQKLETMLDSMIEGIVVLDAAGRLTLANRAAESLFGFSRFMTGGTLLAAVRHHEVAAVAARVAAGATAVVEEVRLEGPPPRFLQVSAAALRGVGEARTGAVLVFHDVTRLRELEGVRQDFVANVSHELRTPLSLIKSAAETLLDGARSDPVAVAKLLAIIDRHADRLTLLIDDLLLLAKLDADRITLSPEPLALRAAVQDVLDDLAPRALTREVRLENLLPAGLVAQADSGRLRQVLSNLVDNAIKYGRPGGAVIISGGAAGKKFLELCVRDDGPGIPAEALPRVFERFYRVDKARSREQGGTGLGLAIVKHVVKAHGGEVRVESEPGRGAAFFFTLPAA